MTVTRFEIGRRQLLKSGLGTLAFLPFARARADALPLNFICVYHPHGVSAEYWALRTDESESSFDIGYENCSLQPFESFKDKLLVLEGIDHLSTVTGHQSAGTILTGSTITNLKPANASLDQVLAVDHMLGADTPVTSIALGVGDNATDSGATLSYGAGGAPLPKIMNPVEAFDMLFASVILPDGGSALTEHKRKLGHSILDFIRGEVGVLQQRLSTDERLKLDQHVSALRDIEKRLTPHMPPASCKLPQRPDAAAFPKLLTQSAAPYFDAITDAHIDVLASAIACGVTRFATLLMGDLSYKGNPLGLPEDNHGSVAHTYSASSMDNSGDPATWLPLAKLNRYSYSKVARLMQRLDALGALENTLIYVASDMGNPSRHTTQNVPTLLCGGAGGKFRMGRHLQLGGVANNHLLISIAQVFGVELDDFGTQPEDKHRRGALSLL